jgi:hypothetical protein
LDLRGPASGRHLRRRRQRLSLLSVVVFKKSLGVRIAVSNTQYGNNCWAVKCLASK